MKVVSVYYTIDGERYPRVTAICAVLANAGLAYWRGRVGNEEADRVSRKATDLGTRAHKAIELYARDMAHWRDAQDDIRPIVQAYARWHMDHVREVVACEKLVVSRVHKFAGTVDLVAVLDDDPSPTVIDIKTSNSISETWGLQLGAYQLALDEEGLACGRRVIVQLPSREPGVCHQHDLIDHAQDQRAFINALKLYRWRESLKPPEPTGPRIRFGSKA
jgi:hypothetical protein